jgi:histidine triad (HIT) family protein
MGRCAAASAVAGRPEHCIFCDICDAPAASRVLYQSQRLLAFHDIRPAAKHHLLVVPRQHIPNVSSLGPQHAELGGWPLQAGWAAPT